MQFDPADPVSLIFRDRVDAELTGFLRAKATQLAQVSPVLAGLTQVATEFVAGGKRLRPAFAYWGYVAAASDDVPAQLWPAISAFELLHAGVLMHDDVLDSADTRRGRPSVHRQFETQHQATGGRAAAEFGRAMAVLLGDQLLVWSGELAESSGLAAEIWQRAKPYWHLVRTEVNSGQMLDVCAQYQVPVSPMTAEQLANAILEEKTSRYTVQRPAQFGAAAGGASDELIAALGRYGLALGRAFQLRDDLLGVFGDVAQTGKPAAGDLIEGKQTVLLARALAGLSEVDRAKLAGLVGRDLDADEVAFARELIVASGAVDQVEAMIAADYAAALDALGSRELSADGQVALAELARQSVERQF